MKKHLLFFSLTIVILSGSLITSALGTENSLYATGHNSNGELGLGDNLERNTPTLVTIPDNRNVIQCSAGSNCSLITTAEGELYAMGQNLLGQLGTGDNIERNTPTLITVPDGKTISRSSASSHSLLITSDGELYVTGFNSSGQLGTGDTASRNTFTPVTVSGGKIVSRADTGVSHSLLATHDGNLYTMGENSQGQLATGDTADRNTPTLIPLPDSKLVAQVAGGFWHNLLVTTDGLLYVQGRNNTGQLGTGDNIDRNTFTPIEIPGGKTVSQVDAGMYHSLILTTDGKCYAMGENVKGQLGTGDNTDRNTPTLVTVPSGNSIAQCSAGSYASYLVTTSGELYAMGSNSNGELGTGDNTDRNTPTRIVIPDDKITMQAKGGYNHALFITRDAINAGRSYHSFANTESHKFYPLDATGVVSEPYTYEVIGSLPEGLFIRDGMLRGVAVKTGTYNFAIRLNNEIDQLTFNFSIKVLPPTLQPIIAGIYLNGVFTNTTVTEPSTHTTPAITELYNATVPIATPLEMSFDWDYIKGESYYSIVGGTLPGGLHLDGITGEITGIPITSGEYIFVVSVKDWRGRAFQWIRLVIE